MESRVLASTPHPSVFSTHLNPFGVFGFQVLVRRIWLYSFLSYTGFAAPPAHQRELSSPVSLRSLLHACAGAQGASGPKGTQGVAMGAQGALRAPWAIGG